MLGDLRAKIYSGEILPGEHLRQHDLAQQLGVSRVPLREAMLVLASQGVLIHENYRGFKVAKRNDDERAQIHWLLETLENEVYRTLEWPDAAALAELTRLSEEMSGFDDLSTGRLVQLNSDFHMKLWDLSPMKVVVSELSRMWGISMPAVTRAYEERDRVVLAVKEHYEIIDALEAQNRGKLFEVTHAHRLFTSGVSLLRSTRRGR